MNFSQFNMLIWILYLKYEIDKVTPAGAPKIDVICLQEHQRDVVNGNISIWKYQNMIKSKNIFDIIYGALPDTAIYAFTDGASRGNPGDAGSAAMVKFGKMGKWYKLRKYIGKRTNNQAEIYAIWLVLKGIYQYLQNHQYCKKIFIFTDSELVVNIFCSSRIYRKNSRLIAWIYNEIKFLIQNGWHLKFFNVKGHVDIHDNNIVDRLAVKASMDFNHCMGDIYKRPELPCMPVF